ncbi:hypothetical protein [Siphonobacter sp. BAB-5385]
MQRFVRLGQVFYVPRGAGHSIKNTADANRRN